MRLQSLSKHDDGELAQKADALVLKWMKLVKNNDDSKEKDRRKERKDKDRSSKRSDDKKKVCLVEIITTETLFRELKPADIPFKPQ